MSTIKRITAAMAVLVLTGGVALWTSPAEAKRKPRVLQAAAAAPATASCTVDDQRLRTDDDGSEGYLPGTVLRVTHLTCTSPATGVFPVTLSQWLDEQGVWRNGSQPVQHEGD